MLFSSAPTARLGWDGLVAKGECFRRWCWQPSTVPQEARAKGFLWTSNVTRLWLWMVTLQLNSLGFFVSCLILRFVFAFVAWECPSAMAVLLRPDPGGCTKTPLLWGRHRIAAGGHGEWSVEGTPWLEGLLHLLYSISQ